MLATLNSNTVVITQLVRNHSWSVFIFQLSLFSISRLCYVCINRSAYCKSVQFSQIFFILLICFLFCFLSLWIRFCISSISLSETSPFSAFPWRKLQQPLHLLLLQVLLSQQKKNIHQEHSISEIIPELFSSEKNSVVATITTPGQDSWPSRSRWWARWVLLMAQLSSQTIDLLRCSIYGSGATPWSPLGFTTPSHKKFFPVWFISRRLVRSGSIFSIDSHREMQFTFFSFIRKSQISLRVNPLCIHTFFRSRHFGLNCQATNHCLSVHVVRWRL